MQPVANATDIFKHVSKCKHNIHSVNNYLATLHPNDIRNSKNENINDMNPGGAQCKKAIWFFLQNKQSLVSASPQPILL